MKKSVKILLIPVVAILSILVMAYIMLNKGSIKKEITIGAEALVTSETNNQITIKKTDLNGKPLANTKYTITLDNVKELRVNGSDFITYSPTNEGYDVYNLELDGETNSYKIISSTHSGNSYAGKLTITTKTDLEGLIVLTDIKPFNVGDIDMNGLVEDTDVNLIADSEELTDTQKKLADINFDTVIDENDSEYLSEIFTKEESTPYATINGIVTEIEALSGYQKVEDKKFIMDLNNSENSFTIVKDFDTNFSIEDDININIINNQDKTEEIVINTYVPETECTVFINNVKELSVNGSDTITYSPTNQGNDTYVINEDGTITQTHSGEKYTGKMNVTVKTDTEGKITLSEITPLFMGDVDMDGVISAADWRLTSNHWAGSEEINAAQSYLADIDKNNIVGASDVRLFQRYFAGQEIFSYAEVYGVVSLSTAESIKFGTLYGENQSSSTNVQITKETEDYNRIVITKTDENGEAIVGRTYTINLSFIKSLKVNGSDVITYLPTIAGYDTYTVSKNGEITESTHSQKQYSGKLIITAKTNEEGKIVLDEVKPFYKGDVEMDGTVGAGDARYALRASVRFRKTK